MRSRLKILIQLIILLTCHLLFSQYSFTQTPKIIRGDLQFEHIDIAEPGSFANAVNVIIQDRLGFLWLGTGNGLHRYDGYTVETYTYKMEDTLSLSQNNINNLLEDRMGNLWIGTIGGGLNCFNRKTGQFKRYQHNPNDTTSLSHNRVLDIYEADNGKLWIATDGGTINLFDPKTGSFKRYGKKYGTAKNISGDLVFCLYEDKLGTFWVGSWGLHRFDPNAGTFTNYLLNQKNPLNEENQVFVVYEDSHDTLWVGTERGLFIFNRKTEKFSLYARYFPDPHLGGHLAEGNIYSIFEDNQGDIWIGIGTDEPYGSLLRLDRESHTFIAASLEPGVLNSWQDRAVGNIFEDRFGILWAGTSQGLSKFDRRSRVFKHYPKMTPDGQNVPEERADFIRNAWVDAVAEDHDDNLWFGLGSAGLARLDRENQTYNYYVPDPDDPTSLSHLSVFSLLVDRDGTLWIGTGNRFNTSSNPDIGLNRYNKTTDSFISYKHNPKDPNSISNGPIKSLLEDRNGFLWIGTTTGELNRFDKITGQFKHYPLPGKTTVLDMLEDQHGKIWISAVKGIFEFNPKTGLFELFCSDGNDCPLPSEAIHEDPQGVIWFASSNGLFGYDPDQDNMKQFTIEDGLPTNFLQGILDGNEDELWMGTFAGIVHFNKQTETFRTYSRDRGVQGSRFAGTSFFKSKKGELFFGGINGVNAFFPEQIQDNLIPPEVVLTDLEIFGQSITKETGVLQNPIYETREINLSYDQNDLTFEYVGLHFTDPPLNSYAYKLEGYDDWREVGTRKIAVYNNLDPGSYTFQVKAANKYGAWNEKGASVNITIAPPWWRTTWAYFGYFILFISIVFLFDRVQRNRLIRRERLKSVEAELEEARQLQLSMLPKEVPQLPDIEIAAYMKTATEVGGDYYDFHVGEDGTLTVVVGDATGHGLKAGTMVTAAKSLFGSLAENPDILSTFQEMSKSIKSMKLPLLSMCFTMLKIKDGELKLSSAGIPPVLIYRNVSKKLEELSIDGMPLGAMDGFPYREETVPLEPGDTVLLMSDGFPELMNAKEEMLDYERAYHSFTEVAEKSPQDVIDHLNRVGQDWANGKFQGDDITFVVLKVKM